MKTNFCNLVVGFLLVISVISLVDAASIHLREKRDLAFNRPVRDQYHPVAINHGGSSEASSNAGSRAEGQGHHGGSSGFSNAESSATAHGGSVKSTSDSKSESFTGANGSYTLSSSSSSSSSSSGDTNQPSYNNNYN